MIEYIKGHIADISPAHVVLETSNIGYFVSISLYTYTALAKQTEAKLYIYEAIREDAHILYGFIDQKERQVFLHLISVSGIGANTARMMLSSYSAAEIEEMIAAGNVAALKSIKGIGQKTAERVIVDLRDKMKKTASGSTVNETVGGQVQEEALSALVMLGFNQSASQKVIQKILSETPALTVEQLIKSALKML
jgi:Holliday junction DNA helicase RuvA